VKRLSDLLEGAFLALPLPGKWGALEISGLEYDSRRVTPGAVFFAFPGSRTDGRAFAAEAVERGAVAVVSESEAPEGFAAPWIRAAHGRQTLARMARRFYDEPDRAVALTGVTGTNGKTTTVHLLDELLRRRGRVTGMIGTVVHRAGAEERTAVNTTPESLEVVRLLAEVRGLGGTHVTMEVSSHALALGRVFGLDFRTAIFSNLTQDHLDFHGTMEDYFAAKCLLFEGAGGAPPCWAVINTDDAWGRRIRTADGTRRLTYGFGEGVDVRGEGFEADFQGMKLRVRHPGGTAAVESPLTGRMNAYNLLAAFAAALTLDLDAGEIAEALRACQGAPGRFERVDEGQPFLVVVDYAHTDDALRNVIAAARGLKPKRVLTLFGCGGDRDRRKRPLMGQAAGELSDFVILTSDNPRSEDPLAILNDALVGLRRTDTPHVMEPDRGEAIRIALNKAQPGDVVILAGKGHETYQVLRDRTIAFDDREAARAVLRGFGYGKGTDA
jgi:UDP-N-acetylmuramoyl-L-alanyl-D-glutamate--2,6-diaminopimelate ligase